ncbi:CoA transferase [Amycolatopsis sp. K13G38]|uniref:CoA transferase n=1 Tax=Amycolatopsis acididurans TaxID=2724524 RepID=A0ABX1IWP5_9PSEU|nr:CaiB/BaiF CoA-transferase family protein [Amycolatopsis acididurans]NKQ51912.1 CoA transferase [Amycolatopsis acididurans]
MKFTGPLAGTRVVEIGSIGPGPFCAMLLADLGADVIRVDRAAGAGLVSPNSDFRTELLHRGRRSVAVDLKHPDGPAVVLDLVARADVLIEGFRPGVAERLGIGPEVCAERNPGLVYGRMTGFGQDGPMAQAVGHDLNYVALSGLLSLIGRRGQPPTPPLSLIGDFGGGGLLLAFGLLAALLERQRSGRGQVVDAAMAEGAALLGTPFFGYRQTGSWHERGANLVDSGAPFYDAYETADGRWLSVAALEQRFYDDLVDLLELPADLPDRDDRANWPVLKKVFADAVRRRTRDEWAALAEGRSPCVAPVLEPDEAPRHPQHVARRAFTEIDGLTQPAPAPKFSRTPAQVDAGPPLPGEHTVEALRAWGVDDDRLAAWQHAGAIRQEE